MLEGEPGDQNAMHVAVQGPSHESAQYHRTTLVVIRSSAKRFLSTVWSMIQVLMNDSTHDECTMSVGQAWAADQLGKFPYFMPSPPTSEEWPNWKLCLREASPRLNYLMMLQEG